MARIFRGTPRNLALLAAALRRGELVAVPTETVYGLAADATNVAACRKIFRAKRRPQSDPLIVHLHHRRQLSTVAEPNPAAEALAAAFWPGPLTLILPKKATVPDIVTAGSASVAVRVPAHPLFRRLLRLCDRPLAAPSANPFGYVSPTSAQHVQESLGARIAYILDGGPCQIGVESTIVDLRDPDHPELLRPGAITAEQVSEVLRRPVQPRRQVVARGAATVAPGQLARHYSPRTPVTLHEQLPATVQPGEARVFYQAPSAPARPGDYVLSRSGSGKQAARRLFALLRELDQGAWRRIHIQLAPATEPLAEAVNDRLRRAAARR